MSIKCQSDKNRRDGWLHHLIWICFPIAVRTCRDKERKGNTHRTSLLYAVAAVIRRWKIYSRSSHDDQSNNEHHQLNKVDIILSRCQLSDLQKRKRKWSPPSVVMLSLKRLDGAMRQSSEDAAFPPLLVSQSVGQSVRVTRHPLPNSYQSVSWNSYDVNELLISWIDSQYQKQTHSYLDMQFFSWRGLLKSGTDVFLSSFSPVTIPEAKKRGIENSSDQGV